MLPLIGWTFCEAWLLVHSHVTANAGTIRSCIVRYRRAVDETTTDWTDSAMTTFTDLEELADDTTQAPATCRIAEALASAVRDWPTYGLDTLNAYLIELRSEIEGPLTLNNVRAKLDSYTLVGDDVWKAASLCGLLGAWDIADVDVTLDELINRAGIHVLDASHLRFSDFLQQPEPAYAIFTSALAAAFDANDAVTEHIERLSPEARLVYLVWCLDGEIHNGGFDQFLYNSLCDHWSELLSHLDTIGAVISKRLLAQAVSIFPDSTPSTNRQERLEQLKRLSAAEVEALLSHLDEEFWKYKDDLAQRVNDFVMQHPNATITLASTSIVRLK